MLSLESVREEYKQNNKINSLTSDDERLINAIFNLRKNYAIELEKRKTTKLISIKEINFVPVIHEKTQDKTKKTEKSDAICQATKLDGNKCTAKAKIGCVFCGRHLPKQK